MVFNYVILNLMDQNEQSDNLNTNEINKFISQQLASHQINDFDFNKINEFIQNYDTIWSSLDLHAYVD